MARRQKTCGRKQSRFGIALGGVGDVHCKNLSADCAKSLKKFGDYNINVMGTGKASRRWEKKRDEPKP